ncbi:MAG: hypothetical protein ACLP7Q_21445 [Isosphaeraceae bacterium]
MTIVTAILAVYIAGQGLSTWRRQLSANARHDLARRWILSAYKLRDEVENVRRAGWHSTEAAAALAESGVSLDGLSEKEKRQAVALAVYAKRWKPLYAARSELNVNSLEAQVLWGNAARETFLDVSRVTQKLWAAIVVDQEFSESGIVEDRQERMERKKIMWCMTDSREKDEFMVELNAAIAKIEEIGKPHLITR